MLKFHKDMAVPLLLYGSKSWTMKVKDWMTAQMKCLIFAEVCNKIEYEQKDRTENFLVQPKNRRM
jgi:hypothetical protein